VNHVLELFKNLKTKKIKHEKKFGIKTWFMRKLQFQNLSHIVCSPFLFWTLYKQGDVVIQFHIKKCVHMGWANQKVQPKTKKQIMYNSKLFISPNYFSTWLASYLVWPTHLGQPMYLFTYVLTYMNRHLT